MSHFGDINNQFFFEFRTKYFLVQMKYFIEVTPKTGKNNRGL